MQGTKETGPAILHRAIYHLDAYSPWANGCSGEWNPDYSDYEAAFNFLWKHVLEHFGPKYEDKSMRKAVLVLVVLIIVGLAWSNRYRYDRVGEYGNIIVRTNIYTGWSQQLIINRTNGGWVYLTPAKPATTTIDLSSGMTAWPPPQKDGCTAYEESQGVCRP